MVSKTFLLVFTINWLSVTASSEFDVSDKVDALLEVINYGIRLQGKSMVPMKPGKLLSVEKKGEVDTLRYWDSYLFGLDSWERLNGSKAIATVDSSTIRLFARVRLRFLVAVFPLLELGGYNMSAGIRLYTNYFNVSLTVRKHRFCFSFGDYKFYADDALMFSSNDRFDNVTVSRFFKGDIQYFLTDPEEFKRYWTLRFLKYCHFIYVLNFDAGIVLDFFIKLFRDNIYTGLSWF